MPVPQYQPIRYPKPQWHEILGRCALALGGLLPAAAGWLIPLPTPLAIFLILAGGVVALFALLPVRALERLLGRPRDTTLGQTHTSVNAPDFLP